MKLVFSRKGFDSRSGGFPSPILPDGRLISFPIPEEHQEAGISYDDLLLDDHTSYQSLAEKLGMRTVLRGHDRIPIKHAVAHLDPDINAAVRPRPDNWMPIFGQANQAQTHLLNNHVGQGDIFLFFGLFRNVSQNGNSLKYYGPMLHVIWGYMEIGQVVNITNAQIAGTLAWARSHPHMTHWDRTNNTVYIASSRLSLLPSRPGAAVFHFREDRVLTKKNATCSIWTLPGVFEAVKTTMTYHRSPGRWPPTEGDNVTLNTVGRGQEFVTTATPEIQKWVRGLIE